MELIVKNKPKNLVFNSIVLLVKYYIFSSKYKLQRPTINGFLQLLHQTREIEEHIAFSKDKLEVHRKKMATTPNHMSCYMY